MTKAVLVAALATHARFGISYWDAAVIEAARQSGAEVVLSEDLIDGQDYDGVRVENPFRELRTGQKKPAVGSSFVSYGDTA